jgi:hypothetical protein
MRLRRIRLDSVGHPDARFDPLLLDFRGDDGQALDTVLWLRNAGGKTSLLSLVFSVLQPNRNWFLGYLQKGRAKSIDKYVLPDDVAHVVLEWEGEGLPGFGVPFVTGAVMAQRSEGGEDRLARFFYAFKPVDGALSLDELPIREHGRRTPYRRYRQLLEDLAGRYSATELVIRDHQGEWHDYLDANQLDPEMFRYQLTMNRDEGGAVKLLEGFSDADTFIDFLVDVVSDPADAAEVSQNLAQVADKIEMRPRREREREFVAGVAERLRPLADAHRAWRAVREEHTRVILDGSRLRRRIAQSAAAAEALAEQQGAEARRQKESFDAAERLRSQYDRQANALQVDALRFRVQELGAEAAAARDLEDEANRLTRAWQASEIVAELNEVEEQAAALRAALARETEDAEGLRYDYERAAMRLRRRLEGLAENARRTAGHAETFAKASAVREAEEGEREMAAAKRVAAIDVELDQIRRSLGELDRRVGVLTRDGLVERGETATAALVRLRRRDLGVMARLDAIPVEREPAERARASAAAEAAELSARIGDLRGRHDQVRRDRDQLVRRAREIGEHERVPELVGHESVDVLVAGNAISERLIDAIADAERRLVEIQVEALEDRRALASIEQTSLLPAAVSIEQAVARLQEDRLSATTGWQYLAQNVRREDWPRLLATSPQLLDAVVVQPGRLERTAELLSGATFASLTGSLTVVESTEFAREPEDGHRLWTLPPAPARYDTEAAGEERARREAEVAAADRRLEGTTGRRDVDHALLLRLRQLLDDCPPGHLERLAFELEQQRQELETLDRRRREQEAAAAGAEERLGELLTEERRLNRERHELGRDRGRLEPVAAQEEQRDTWLKSRAELDEERRRHLDEQDGARQAKEEARADVGRWTRDAIQAGNDARSWLGDVARMPHFDVAVETPPEAVLDALRAEYQTLRDQYELRTSRSHTALEAAAASQRVGRLRSGLEPFADVEDRARELLASAGAESAGFRAERLQRARHDQEDATRLRLRAEEDQRRAEEALTKLTRESRNLTTLPDELRPRDRAHAERLLADLSARRDQERARRDEADAAQRGAAARAKDAAHEHELLRSEERHLVQTLAEQGTESHATYDAITAAAAKQEVERIVGALQDAAKAVSDEEGHIRRAATILRQFAGRSEYDALEGPYRERLTDPDDRALAGRAEGDLVEFERRLPFLDHQLAEIEKHQSRVAEQLLVLVDGALQNLRWLQRQEMPEGLGQWSGQHYFQIRYELPETHDERRIRIGLLLDEAVTIKPPLRGMKLVQQALRRVNRRPHFEVNVLKPNEGLRLERAGVAEIGAWSGGQKLTTAILIYCALARLRADNRSQQRTSPVGVLLLDNPIGTANLSTLIDLQRLVAEKFGVQLIYTTGIDDKPALAPFTNVVRLGNRRERRRERGHIVIEDATDDEVTVVEAARVFRRGAQAG